MRKTKIPLKKLRKSEFDCSLVDLILLFFNFYVVISLFSFGHVLFLISKDRIYFNSVNFF